MTETEEKHLANSCTATKVFAALYMHVVFAPDGHLIWNRGCRNTNKCTLFSPYVSMLYSIFTFPLFLCSQHPLRLGEDKDFHRFPHE